MKFQCSGCYGEVVKVSSTHHYGKPDRVEYLCENGHLYDLPHYHKWKEVMTEFDYKYSSISGYECECGKKLPISDVVDILNEKGT